MFSASKVLTAHHLVAAQLSFMQGGEYSMQNALAKIAAGIYTDGAPNLARGMSLVNVTMQAKQGLITLDGCAHGCRANGFKACLAQVALHL